MANLVEIIVGTYEEFLLGYKVEDLRDENKLRLTQSFATRSHTGSIRCVAINKHLIASGGADDRVFVYDMKVRKEKQVLHHHEGTVNVLAFTPDGSHLLTGSDDGKMCAVRLNTWQLEGLWNKAHSGQAVTHISCHPSGKLALTLGNDQTLRTWNLIKGRLAYTTSLKTKAELGRFPECLSWSPDGEHFTISGARIVEIWNVKSAGVVKDFKCESKPTSVCWLDENELAIGFEDGKLWIVDFNKDSKPTINEAHNQRVKDISYVNNLLATTSSSGEVCLWAVKRQKKSITKIASVNIGCRPTCIELLDLTQFDDDYVLKMEDESDEEVPEEKVKQDTERIRCTGNVVIEYEDDDVPESLETSSNDHKTMKKQKKKDKKALKQVNVAESIDERTNSKTKKNEETESKKSKKKRKSEKSIENGNGETPNKKKLEKSMQEDIEETPKKQKKKNLEKSMQEDNEETPKKQKKKKFEESIEHDNEEKPKKKKSKHKYST